MKKSIFAIAILALITTGTTMAQRGYAPGYNNGYPAQNPNPRNDDYQDEIRIDRLDALVGLTRHQERTLRRIGLPSRPSKLMAISAVSAPVRSTETNEPSHKALSPNG